jgi:Winged helix DNA-binding domain
VSREADRTITARARNRALLARQLLLERSEDLPAYDAVEHLVGLQAQAIQPPYYALWSRLHDFDPHELGGLLTKRHAVRMRLMRSTVHLVTSNDALLLWPLLQEVIERTFNGSFRRRTPDVAAETLVRTVREMLPDEAQALTGREIATRLVDSGIGDDIEAVMYLAGVHVPLVQVPPRGVWGAAGQAKYVTLEQWAGRPTHANAQLDAVVVRYLRAFGPASVMDFQKWSGLTRCKVAFDRLREQLLTFRDEDGSELFDLPDAPRPNAETPAPPRFLGEFDNVLLSHASRRHIVPNGMTPWMDPTQTGRHVNALLIDGTLRATWWIERKAKRRASLVIRPFDRLKAGERRDVIAEAERMIAFAAADVRAAEIRLEL